MHNTAGELEVRGETWISAVEVALRVGNGSGGRK